MEKIIKKFDNVTFQLKRDFDFSWLTKYGKVFCVYDQQDSGNICFGVENENRKLFIKYAGAPTINYEGTYEDAILRIKNSIPVYEDIKHPNLIKLIEHFKQGNNRTRSIEDWKGSEELFQVAKKATSKDRTHRYQSINDLYTAWILALI